MARPSSSRPDDDLVSHEQRADDVKLSREIALMTVKVLRAAIAAVTIALT